MRIPNRVPKTQQEVDRFFLAIMRCLGGTAVSSSDIEKLLWTISDSGGDSFNSKSMTPDDVAKLLAMVCTNTNTDEKQMQDTLTLHWMGV